MRHEAETGDRFAEARAAMLEKIAQETVETAGWTGRPQLRPEVLEAMGRVPREKFLAPQDVGEAYRNRPLPIGCAQTISQPFIVALMSDLCGAAPGKRILEVGTGCGYQAAVLAELGCDVWSVESISALYKSTCKRLHDLDYAQVHLRHGDGTQGWPEAAPFDGILVTAAAAQRIPPALIEQLSPGGALVCPVAEGGSLGSLLGQPTQKLCLIEKDAYGVVSRRAVLPVAFVPLVEGS